MPSRLSVLLIEDAAGASRVLQMALEASGVGVVCVRGETSAAEVATEQTFDLAVVDVDHEGGEDRAGALLELFAQRPVFPPVIVTVQGGASARAAMLEAGAADVVSAGDIDELVARVRRRGAEGRVLKEARGEAERMQALAMTDGLTQVANHRSFQGRLVDEFRRAQRYDDPLAIIMADVDHFKHFNDRYGHQAGDEALRALAGCLKAAVRETDFVARYGGEEFVVLLPKTHLKGALNVAERISDDVRSLRLGPDRSATLTSSCGLSWFPSSNVMTPQQLVRTADEALLRAKREGRARIKLHQSPLASETLVGRV